MTTYKEVELKQIIEEAGSVTITVVGDQEPFDETFDNFDEAKNAILSYENTNTVYF